MNLKKTKGKGGKSVSLMIPKDDSITNIDIWAFEEQDVEQRDSARDFVLYQQTCAEIRKLMKEILELKKRKLDAEVTEKRIQASLLFVTLKKLNRLDKLRSKKQRDGTNETKQRVDSFHLQLQNLLYESLHLKKEVDKCLEFKSKDEEIELVPVSDFYKDAPKKISKPNITKDDPHQLMLARLDWELEQRKQLAAKCKDAQRQKQEIATEIKNKREYLENLAPRLSSILQATKPLQDYLDMPLEARRIQHKTACFLPRSLFILYVQASAFQEACDKNVIVTVDGDLDEAKALKDTLVEQDEDSGDSDQEELSGEKRFRRRTVDRMSDSRRKLLKKHPLSVVFTLKCNEGSLILHFNYMMVLNIITVTVQLTTNQNIIEGDALSPDTLLACLFPDDFGNTTPNAANKFQLRKLGMDDFENYLNETGRPYIWAQRLAGLEFLPSDVPISNTEPISLLQSITTPQPAVSSSHIEQTIQAIRHRFLSRISLNSQIESLAKGVVPVHPDFVAMFPTKISSRLITWKSIPEAELMGKKQCQYLIENGLIVQGGMTFCAVVEKGSAKLKAYININPDYPATPPVFSLSVSWKYERTAETDTSLWALEQELNVYCHELIKANTESYLLSHQIQRLLMCFDVYLEIEATNEAIEGPFEFPKEKVYLRTLRGRNHSKPYKYLPNLGVFTHR